MNPKDDSATVIGKQSLVPISVLTAEIEARALVEIPGVPGPPIPAPRPR